VVGLALLMRRKKPVQEPLEPIEGEEAPPEAEKPPEEAPPEEAPRRGHPRARRERSQAANRRGKARCTGKDSALAGESGLAS